MLQQYFDARTGRPLTEKEALKNGILRDNVVQRVRMVARDSKMPSFIGADFVNNRPGYRGSFSDWLGDARREAYAAHRDYLENAWRNPTTKLADATDKDAAAADDDDNDKRSIAQRMADHKANMDKVYTDYAARQSGAWKEGK
jgi:hypothetical protein